MSFDSIHNYYEQLVFHRLNEMVAAEFIESEAEFLCDVACVALNHLPARYVRHEVDMVFYMTPDERERIDREVRNAVSLAVDYVLNHRRLPTPASARSR
ncbi:MAG: late competence development ComFB family protein [Gammaproteobacteria bacterium]|nr:late competence development ComFB family protein [Gammaproteobacteria bacterium]